MTTTGRDDPQSRTRWVPCPHCGQPASFAPGNRWRPFCSERCRTIDLGAWASESYRVSSSADNSGAAAGEGDRSDREDG